MSVKRPTTTNVISSYLQQPQQNKKLIFWCVFQKDNTMPNSKKKNIPLPGALMSCYRN